MGGLHSLLHLPSWEPKGSPHEIGDRQFGAFLHVKHVRFQETCRLQQKNMPLQYQCVCIRTYVLGVYTYVHLVQQVSMGGYT